MELNVEKVNVDLEMGTVIITGYDIQDIISEIGITELLNEFEYSDVFDYVMEAEKEKEELAAELSSAEGR